MLELEVRIQKIEGGSEPYSIFHLPYSMFNKCVQAVFSLGKDGGLSNNLRTAVLVINESLCSTRQFITNQCTAFASSFAPLFDTSLYPLNNRLIHSLHSSNKNNEILYKLITINKGE